MTFKASHTTSGWLTHHIWILQTGNTEPLCFPGGIITARKSGSPPSNLGSEQRSRGGAVTQPRGCAWLTGTWAGGSLLGAAPAISWSVPTKVGVCGRCSCNLKSNTIGSSEKEWATAFCCLTGELEMTRECSASLPITQADFRIPTPKCFGPPRIWGTHTNVPKARRKAWRGMIVWGLGIFVVIFTAFIKVFGSCVCRAGIVMSNWCCHCLLLLISNLFYLLVWNLAQQWITVLSMSGLKHLI